MKNKMNRLLAFLLTLAIVLPMALPVFQVSAAQELATQTATVQSGAPAVDRLLAWDFSSAQQINDFSLYQSATSAFTVTDGVLASDGLDGELKAIVTDTPENIQSVSVDILPGASGLINAGLYIGASDAANSANGINAMVFQIQSNFTGWTDAPNRIDIIQGQFAGSWEELSRTISEAGNGNALFSGGNKQALNLKLTFGEDTILMTLSLVSNSNKYIQLLYQVDSSAFDGQIGLRANGSDVRLDNLQIAYKQALTENQKLWDFSDSTQAEDFTFYANGNNSFSVSDGMLKPDGGHGEMKAIFNEDMANIAAVSVDIIPGASGLMNAGVYVGAKNVSADQDKADAIAVMIESMFSGWDDAPNRIDLWLGKFAQGWAGEVAGSRLVSEAINQPVYTNGVKQPLTLKLEFGENIMTATLSLKDNPNRCATKTWTMEAGQLAGQIGLRNQFIDLCYDNFIVTYKEPVEQPAPEEETVYANDGYNFCQSSLRPWKLTADLTATPYTLEAWVNAPQGVHDNAVGYIVGNASRAPSVSMQMIASGKLQLSYKMENADLTVTTKTYEVDTDLRTGKWTHVAYTCNVETDTVVAYINGEAVKTWTNAGLEAITIPDKIVPGNTFAIGSLESSDDAKNKLLGFIADVRMWDSALSATQIAESMMTQYTDAKDGLLFNAPLAELTDGVFADLSGNGNTVALYDSMLNLQAETHEPGAYSMVVIPDQQILNNYHPEKLMAMYQWIADNREKENIQIVMNVGDMADNCGNITQWENNRAAVELLPDDLPFIAAPGNHDYDTNSGWNQGYGVRQQLTLMNEYLPRSLFESYPTEIGFFDEVNSANQWQSFSVNGNNYLVMALEYVPQDDVLAWANDVVTAHPNHQVILVTHSYVGSYGNLDLPQVWNDFLKNHENVIMAFSGHVWHTNVVRRTDKGVNGNDVHQMLMDAQVSDTGNEGNKHAAMIGLLRFNADGTQCDVSYYSTDRDMYDADSSFTLQLSKQEQTFVATAGGKSYTSVNLALASGERVQLLADITEAVTVSADAVIDLAGFDMANVTVSEGVKLTLVDTATDDYTGDYGHAAVSGTVEIVAEVDGKHYVAVNEDGTYSAHAYDVVLTHVSLKPADDALGYKAKLIGDEVVLSHATTVGFHMWVEDNQPRTFSIPAKEVFTLRLKNILAAGGGEMNIHATAFVTFGDDILTSQQHTTTMKDTLQAINRAWAAYSVNEQAAVRGLCQQYIETTSQWELTNILGVGDQIAEQTNDYTAITGGIKTSNISGFTADGMLTAPNNGEGKVILDATPAGNKTVSVDLYPNNSINSGIYLGASNAAAAQDSINAITVMVESNFADNPGRADIVIGNFPAWQQYHRFVIEAGNSLFTNGVKEPVNLLVQVNGNEITATLSLLSDPSKSATTTYTYEGAYDLANGLVGLRSQYSDCGFDNFAVHDVQYTFDSEAATEGLTFYHSSWTDGITATANNTLALHSTATFETGTFGVDVNSNGNYATGIVFGASRDGSSYYLYRVTTDHFIELVKVVDGVQTVLDRGYLSAGHINTNFNRLEVVKTEDTIYCYYYNRFDKINCYAVCDNELTGVGFGLWASTSGAGFRNVTLSGQTETRKAEVLIFGHSYTEMWLDYETYFPEYTDIDDIGIGGSVAVHWEALTDEIISYEPQLGIYNIGINDLTGGTPPKAIIDSMEKALLDIKAALPEFEVVLVSVSHCPNRSTITDTISQTNALMRNLAASYDWMYYAEAEYMFCSDPADPHSTIDSMFIDGLHPSAAGYELMAAAIVSAAKGENQPAFDETLAQQQMAEVKANKLAALHIYGEAAYTAENWATAKPHYDAAVAKINACTTETQLKDLDLSAELAALQSIPGKAADLIENLVTPVNRDALAADSWIKTDNNTVNVNGFSYALDRTNLYADQEMVFKLSNNSGTVATGGVFLRATAQPNNGIVGYLINYVSAENYMQVYYVNNVYNTDGSAFTLKYLGGVVYGAYGEVENTVFYAKVEGSKLYLNTLARMEAGEAYLTEVDLTDGGNYELISSGYTGVLSWNNGVSFDMTVHSFAAEPLEDNTLRVLAIGNSFSIDGMEYAYQIAKDLGVEKIKLGNLYIGGCTLATHYANLQSDNAAYTYYVNTDGNWVATKNYSLKEALLSDNWDVITFQQASGYSGVVDSYDTLTDLIAGVKELCTTAKFGWHMTWAYQGDSTHGDFAKYNNDQSTMYQAIVSAVQNKILTNEDIDFVIPAGTAIQNARTSYLGDSLTRDGYHLSYDIGRYIAGITWVEALTGLDASNLTYCPAGVTEEVMALCIESAKNAAATPYAVTNSQYTLENCYLELDLNLASGWYSSTNTSGDPYKIYASTSSLAFYYTKVFTKAELPVGSMILYTGNKTYRPEGWVNGAGTTRPGAINTRLVMVTEDWWGEYTERAFNIGVDSLDVTAEQAAESFKIYVPRSAYIQLDLTLSTGYYNSVFKEETPQALYAWNSALPYYATKIFSKAELPIGTVITYTGAYDYRPDGWVNGVGTTRPGTVKSTCVMVDEAWWGEYTERGFNIKVADTNATAEEVAEVFKIYVPLSAYEKVELSVVKAFYNSNLYPSTKTQAASTSLKFFAVQTFTEDTLPVGSIIVNKEGRNIRLERWMDGTVKNSDGTRGANSTAKQHMVDASWWDGFDTRAFNIPVASLEDSEVEALLDAFMIYVPKIRIDAISGKKIVWLGSSVTYGSATGGYSMADAIAEKREDTVCYKYAVPGTTLVNDADNSYVARLQQIDTSLELDMLVVQLSTNDATQGKALGQISESMDMADFDTTTVAGAIEYIIAYAKDTWNCPVVFYTGTYYESEAYASMVELLLDIQGKWDIGVIDLWNDAEMTALYGTEQYSQYMSDAIHPTALGYKEWWTPVFEEYLLNYWSE